MRKLAVLMIAVMLAALPLAGMAEELTYWAGGESRDAFVSYVTAVTDPDSPYFIPETDRLAVFDLDGTLCGEQYPIYFEWMLYVDRVLDDPDYVPTEEQISVAEQILIAAQTKSIPEGLEEMHFRLNAEAFAGMTVADYRAYVADFLTTEADHFEGLTLGDAWFRTTVEAARYLQENGFSVYVCSGTDRDADRVMIADIIGIPYRQVIGSDCYTVGAGQDDADYLEYQYTSDDIPVRTAEPIIKNVKSSKPMQLMQELGQKPVIAFGNSTGDTSMFMFTTYQNPYLAAAFCIVPDDDEREVAYPGKVEKLMALCEANGWHVVSMKNDFVTVYGEEVTLNMEHTPWLDRMFEKLDALSLEDAA